MIKYLELEISALAGSATHANNNFVILKEKNGERIIPVLVKKMQGITLMARHTLPLPTLAPVSATDVLAETLRLFHTKVTKVVISLIKEGIFFCDVVAQQGEEEHTVSLCKAADGLEIAALFKCPVMITEELMQVQYMQKVSDNGFAMNICTVTGSMLEDALQHALKHEDYETASKIRDELSKRHHTGE